MSERKKTPQKRKKLRRTKLVYRHPNPLFDTWLLEWETEAAQRNSNMKYNFQRARKSLNLFPLPLYSGKDCRVLSHFGDKICQMLDRRLQEYQDENGPVEWDSVHQQVSDPSKKKPRSKRRVSASIPTKRKDGHVVHEVDSHDHPQQNSECSNSSGQKQRRPYIPVVRSGAYALLMALYNASKRDDYQGFLKKTELMDSAQPLCDASFTVSSEGSHYTAWSSMSTLIKKQLVSREGSPARFSITCEGKALAAMLERGSDAATVSSVSEGNPELRTVDDVITIRSRSCSPVSPVKSIATKRKARRNISGIIRKETKKKKGSALDELSDSSEESVSFPSKTLNSEGSSQNGSLSSSYPSSQSSSGQFVFSYVTSLELETPQKDRAVVSVEDDGFLGYLIKCRTSSLLDSGVVYRLDDTRQAPLGVSYAYLASEFAPECSPGLLSPSRASATSKSSTRGLDSNTPTSEHNSKNGSVTHTNTKERIVSSALKRQETSSQSSSCGSLDTLPSLCKADSVASECPPQFFLRPDQYEVILCVDNAETTGGFTSGKRGTKEIIINELTRHGVKYDVRKLHVGDFLWVCCERKSSYGLDNAQKPRELVLPYVIERKRMDDLASSIKDGRFHEQKFRLKQSGLSKPMYLVEEYGSQHISLPEATCRQAIINTQVVDGFGVKVTKDQRESAAFLTIMTRCLQSKYQGKTVNCISRKNLLSLRQSDPSSSLETTETSLMSFTEFNSASVKNRQLNVREMFAKHLLQLHGVSVDKARAIVDKYGTPALLISAYQRLGNTGEREQLLATLKCGKSGRILGSGLSTSIAKLYTESRLL